MLKKHALIVRRITQRLGLDRGSLFLEDEIRRLKRVAKRGKGDIIVSRDKEDSSSSYDDDYDTDGRSSTYSEQSRFKRFERSEHLRNTHPRRAESKHEPMTCGSPTRAAQMLRRQRREQGNARNTSSSPSAASISEAIFRHEEHKAKDLLAQGKSMMQQNQWRAASACGCSRS